MYDTLIKMNVKHTNMNNTFIYFKEIYFLNMKSQKKFNSKFVLFQFNKNSFNKN